MFFTMVSSKSFYRFITITILLLSFTLTSLAGNAQNGDVSECKAEAGDSSCHNNKEAQKLKLIAIPSILASSMGGVCLPLFARSVPALVPDPDMFVIVKALQSGVIFATGFMHLIPDSFDDLKSKRLPEYPWGNFPLTTLIAMYSALLALMIDSYVMSASKKINSKHEGVVKPLDNESNNDVEKDDEVNDDETSQLRRNRVIERNSKHEGVVKPLDNESIDVKKDDEVNDDETSQLRRYRVTVHQVLELGIIVHSVVIGLALGASYNDCSIRSLIAALCYHQFFEGMGLGGCILQAEYENKMRWILVFFFSVTTPFGIALGMGIQKIYGETSPTALIVSGVLNACSAGLLIYMALVDLLDHDFFGPKLQGNMKLQPWAYVAIFIGAGGIFFPPCGSFCPDPKHIHEIRPATAPMAPATPMTLVAVSDVEFSYFLSVLLLLFLLILPLFFINVFSRKQFILKR